jgi:hypothetical protein
MFPIIKIKYNGKRIRLGGFGPKKYQMLQFGQLGVRLIKERVAANRGNNDQSMTPLVRRYASWKRRKGLNPWRDLTGPGVGGHMLDDMRVTYADPTICKIDITRRLSRIKARANQQHAAWYGWSPKDQRALTAAGGSIFQSAVSEMLAGLRGQGRQIFSSGAIWMDPLGMKRGIKAA